jgi:hypothetical protein
VKYGNLPELHNFLEKEFDGSDGRIGIGKGIVFKDFLAFRLDARKPCFSDT